MSKTAFTIHIKFSDIASKVRRGAAGKGPSGFSFSVRNKYNRKRQKETRNRY